MAEAFGYRDTLADILEFSGGKRQLSVSDVCRYTGFCDRRTVHKRFPYFQCGYIQATTLARLLCGGGKR